MANKFLDMTGLNELWIRCKNVFAPKSSIEDIESRLTTLESENSTLKAKIAELEGNNIVGYGG